MKRIRRYTTKPKPMSPRASKRWRVGVFSRGLHTVWMFRARIELEKIDVCTREGIEKAKQILYGRFYIPYP